MTIMKSKVFSFLFLLSFVICALTSCNTDQQKENPNNTESTKAVTDDTPPIVDLSESTDQNGDIPFIFDHAPASPWDPEVTGIIDDFSGTPTESEYDMFTAEAEFETYQKDTEEIKISYTNNHIGYGHYEFACPGLEKKVDGEWASVPFSMNGYSSLYMNREDMWYYVCSSDLTEKFTNTLTIKKTYLYEPWDAGQYRAVIYLAGVTLYAEFEITD